MKLFDRFALALSALRDNRLRTSLSILGITIGITAVIVVSTISKGGNYLIYSELETFGLKSVWIFRDYNEKDPNQKARKGSGIDQLSYQLLIENCCSAVERLTPIVRFKKDHIIHNRNHYSNADAMGVARSFMKVANEDLLKGRSFRKQDINAKRAVAIIGQTTATDLFGNSKSVLGKEFSIGKQKLIVIGLLKKKSREFLASIGSAGGDINNRILLPYTLVQKVNGNSEIGYLRAQATSIDKANLAAQQMIKFLSHLQQNKYNYKKETMANYSKTADNILASVSLIGIIAASVSLLVGGMGIMNMMSTAVLERTREIGLRKAIGASERDILFQFLMEAIFISILGGLLGIALGLGMSELLAYLVGFPSTPEVSSIVLALSVSIIVGIISGYFPAKKAALKVPVKALRYE
ncbi:MAG TPA: FtsX-like permease family protein [Leucothrix sp.]|nr:FtsX-like permease family protein [Leucothrix sp.]